jgi:hypothetical protein
MGSVPRFSGNKQALRLSFEISNSRERWMRTTAARTLVINLGDQFVRWTNDIFMFFGADYEVNIEASQLNIVLCYLMGFIRYTIANIHLRDS